METLPCGHAGPARTRACPHLITDDPPSHYRRLTGHRTEYHLRCESCVDDPAACPVAVCARCAERADDFSFCGLSLEGWRGKAEVLYRDADPGGSWSSSACPVEPLGLAPLPGGWLALTTDGLVRLPDDGAPEPVGPVELPEEPPNTWAGRTRGPALHTSPNGRHAAVVTDFGRHGAVFDLATGSVTLRLDRGDYQAETVPFPLAFLGSGQVVAATAWNRLDAFDPATGRLLTDRGSDYHVGYSPRRPRSDYFHGSLSANPSGRRLVDDGWVWQPAGVPALIDVEAWLGGDHHAAQPDQALTDRGYLWTTPMAWLDEGTFALQRVGPDDRQVLEGVELFDVPSGRSKGVFAGPAGPMWAFGGRLHVRAADGFEVWEPETGARTAFVAGFAPTAGDPVTGRFAELGGGRLRVWAAPAPARVP
ncbi:hypothetical protein OG943_02490 [Amycolatopsis sp. NBC_00345]|uniref:hypothetical protein n=1 Tax=Amycolatopsis sp. NBC_00345 TaxID=2975955 RepID=UPI002E268855